jgi:DNA-binding NtrC family response regulator
VAIEDRETVTVGCLPKEIISPQKAKHETQYFFEPGFNLTVYLDDVAKNYVSQALTATGGSIQKAAPLLGISYRTMRYLIGKFSLNKARKNDKKAMADERTPL